ncbi:MAG: DegT/DnrJ/EryC1/StrS family aminotransferase [Gemmatales bacterium]|nr:DegT/DnrJ/EryC1/StrS family aminotransferase [Gemmatales bacterium]MDW8386154.1 DegT/DnrJ/EryC1/StrS family aminotransferase [Gemmatales bacterium]
MRYPVAAPDLSGNELEYVTECLSSSWISSNGRFIEEFENRVADFVGTRFAIATCNGTAALHIALLALGLKPGDEVIVPTLTYVATANAVTYCGARPVFADVDPRTWNLDPDSVRRLISPKTRGILPVHLYGLPCDMEPILDAARQHGLWVVEDAAEALGATYADRPVGSFGEVATFSFFGNKIVTTGEGGMVVTNDPELAERLRLLRGQGMDPKRRYWHPLVGYNYRMTNIAAAIGTAQMERIADLLAARKRVASWYREELADCPGVVFQTVQPPARSAFWMVGVVLESPLGRDAVMAELAAEGIETRPFFYPVHHFPMYGGCRSDQGCPMASDLAYRGICLPTASYLQRKDVACIAQAFRRAVAKQPRPHRSAVRKGEVTPCPS